jgi:hypothetical protein
LHIFVKKSTMKGKAMASRQYAANNFGMSNVGPKRPKKNKDQGQDMSCSEHGCAAYDSGGGGSNVGTASYKGGSSSGGSATTGEKNVVLTKRQAEKRAVKFEKARAKAPAMKNMTKKQKQSASEMRPSRQDMSAPKASSKPAPQPKKTKKITF